MTILNLSILLLVVCQYGRVVQGFLKTLPPLEVSKTLKLPSKLTISKGVDDISVTVQVPKRLFNTFTKGFDFSRVRDTMATILFQLGFISSRDKVMPLTLAMPIIGIGFVAFFMYIMKKAKYAHPYDEDDPVYNPVQAEQFYSRRPHIVLMRFFRIARLALGFNMKLLRDWRFGLIQENQQNRAEDVLDLLTQMGPTYIKLGQALSIRTDLIPPVYAKELKRLQDAVPAFSSVAAKRILCKELGISDLKEVFTEFSDKPVAAASIGQVYKATLLDGREVAVKVQRPNVLPSIGLDLHVMRLIAPLQTEISNKINGAETDPADVELAYSLVDEWGRGLVAEVDYLLEAQNTIQFSDAMRKRSLNAVISPDVVLELCTKRVMVTEWIQGMRLDRDGSPDVPRLCGLAVNAYLTMLLDTGVLHCDPHPGNLLRTEDGRLCILDWGMTLTLPQDLQYSLLEFIAHCNSENFGHLAEDFVKLGATPPDKVEEVRASGIPEGFAFIMKQLSAGGGPSQITDRLRTEFKARYGDLSDAELSLKVRENLINEEMVQATEDLDSVDVSGVTGILEMMSKRNREIFKLPAYMLYVARAFSTLEGIGLSLDPKYSILQECYPYLAKRLMTDNSPRSRDALRDMLYQDGKVCAEKLLEFSDGFTSYTAITADTDVDGEGNRKAQEAFTDLLLDAEGNLMQELLLDGTAQFTDSLVRVGVDRVKKSPGGRLAKAIFKTPKTVLDMIVPSSLRALTLPVTLPYDIAKAAISLVDKEDIDSENVKSVKLIWDNMSPNLRRQLRQRVRGAVRPSALLPASALRRRRLLRKSRNDRRLLPAHLTSASSSSASASTTTDDDGNVYVPLSLAASNRIRRRMGSINKANRRVPVVMRLSRQLGASMFSNAAERLEEKKAKLASRAAAEYGAEEEAEAAVAAGTAGVHEREQQKYWYAAQAEFDQYKRGGYVPSTSSSSSGSPQLDTWDVHHAANPVNDNNNGGLARVGPGSKAGTVDGTVARSNLDFEIELLVAESLSSFSSTTARAIAKVLDRGIGSAKSKQR